MTYRSRPVEYARRFAKIAIVPMALCIGLGQAARASDLKIIVPAYFANGASDSDWTELFNTATAYPGSIYAVVINPNDGCYNYHSYVDWNAPAYSMITCADSGYTSIVSECHSKGIRVLGYVDSTWGARYWGSGGTYPMNDPNGDGGGTDPGMEAEVNEYYSSYKVDGIWFDDGPIGDYGPYGTDPGYSTSYAPPFNSDLGWGDTLGSVYAGMLAYVHGKGSQVGGNGVVVLNPGTYYEVDSGWMSACDILCDWEAPISSFTSFGGSPLSSTSVPTFASSYPGRFMNIFEGVGADNTTGSDGVQSCLWDAMEGYTGYTYVTGSAYSDLPDQSDNFDDWTYEASTVQTYPIR